MLPSFWKAENLCPMTLCEAVEKTWCHIIDCLDNQKDNYRDPSMFTHTFCYLLV